ncbi:MAG: PqqD family protein [Lachnospiraceae bacterium]|nr:PqqD family protein [Lachnospiraceae bacterium]
MIQIAEGVTYGRVADEAMIVNAEAGTALRVDETGSNIWEMIYKGKDAEDIIEYFGTLYPLQKEQIRVDVMEFIDSLKKEKILL